jgi:hypothetical protein
MPEVKREVYCDECLHCRPARGLESWFGLDKINAYRFATCAVYVREDLRNINPHTKRFHSRIDRQAYCNIQNENNDCPKFEVKEHAE